MTFYQYVTRLYSNEHGPKGDLARDVRMDWREFPKSKSYGEILTYLRSCRADRACIDVFEVCWKEYAASQLGE